MEFSEKVAIVTGGGTGLGKAMAVKLSERGAKLVLASRSLDHIGPAAEEINSGGGQAIAVQTDVREVTQVEAMVQQCVDKFGRVDILINNAAGNFIVQSEKLTPNGWNAVVNIVLNGTWYCSSAAGRQMIKQKEGCILNIIATYAWSGAPGVVHSASAKAGVLAMTRTLAAEWGRYGIRVNALAPGIMVTDGASKNLKFENDEAQEYLRKQVPLGRLTTADEMAELAAFLCSPKAAYLTGDVMSADGGAWLHSNAFMELLQKQV